MSEMGTKSDLQFETIPSSVIVKQISNNQNSVGLIPTLDLLSNKDLFISSELGISFDALLSNAYIHFKRRAGND